MAWPFTKQPVVEKRKSRLVKINITTERDKDGAITSGTAFFEDNAKQSITLPVPVDALGQLILTYTNNLGLNHAQELPSFKEAEQDAIYLICKETDDHKWIAYLGGRTLNNRPCSCPHDSIDWKVSKDWETPERAVGMLFLTYRISLDWILITSDHYFLKLRHETDVDMGDEHCCCG